MRFVSPAKVNLYLEVLGKREDNFHEIETLFEKISIFDYIDVEGAKNKTVIICDNPSIPTDENSLLWRTIQSFNAFLGQDLKFSIKLEKNIPIAAGLGGGSSNAAILLKALNQLYGNILSKEQLLTIAGTLGSDVAFFIGESSFAYGRGRGEIIEEIKSDLKLYHIIVNPPFPVFTKDIYNKVIIPLTLTSGSAIDKMFSVFLKNNDILGVAKNCYNRLQDVTVREHPVLNNALEELLKTGAVKTLLSGSGPSIFGIYEEKKVFSASEKLKKIFPVGKGWKIFVAETYL
ncbi:4-diphosphocytidyl-2-C-methyl-D-erythritol kinase [Candidatus Omnitrophus magneticus]|uniref:4-diphosphocytidyl-2-C-methyl-D-erythritol kinase n=1 Tax=Candidatus Omnitrophus magneticus TaxID=1609969 RepID=A0A0F0CRW9_9BACT|nr:4-diphosphocytidyl-2-C-methyl-D-erythritol kinase [Candidatus Omnitrophus magneticus]